MFSFVLRVTGIVLTLIAVARGCKLGAKLVNLLFDFFDGFLG